LDTTSVAVAQSSNLSDSNTVSIQEDELSSLSKATSSSKAVQANWHAQKRSCSILELDEDSVKRMTSVEDEEDSKLAAIQVYDVGVDYGDDKFLENCSRFKITIVNGERIMLMSQSLIILQVLSTNVLFIIFEKVERLFDHKRFLYDSYLDYKLEDPGTHRCSIHTSTQPKID